MKRVVVSVTNDLTTDQRVAKVCNTLFKNGYDILLVGRKLKDSKELSRSYKTKRLKLFFNSGFLFYAEFNLRLFFFLLTSKKDVLLSNDLDTLLPNYLVARFQTKKLIFDSHELFSEVPELIDRPFVQNTWKKLENSLLPRLKNSYTVCQSIADCYQNKYGSQFKVIKNLPLKKTVKRGKFSFNTDNKKIILYQGAVNLGRGLELMIKSMPLLPNCILVVIGAGDVLEDLKKLTKKKNLKSQVKFLGRIEPEYLSKLTPLADVGISIEEDLGLNYRFALPNKIFDYIQAEIPILVSNLPEMKAVVTDHKVGEILNKRTSEDITETINLILKKDYTKSLMKAKEKLIWENQEEELLNIFKDAK